jgi:regulatory protein
MTARPPATPGGRGGARPSAYAAGLGLLGRREFGAAELRARLIRRGYAAGVVDEAISRLRASGALDDRRAADSVARAEASGKLRGPRRVRARLAAMGVGGDIADAAVSAAFTEVDPAALLERALDRRLRGADAAALDQKALQRLWAALVRQGFSPAAVRDALRRRRAAISD